MSSPFAARSFISLCCSFLLLCGIILHYICTSLVNSISIIFSIFFLRKSIFLSFFYFQELLTLTLLSRKKSMCHKRRVEGWMRPAIEHAQDVLYWWVNPAGGVFFHRFFEHFRVFIFCSFLPGVFCFCSLVVSFFFKSGLFWFV